MLIHPIPALLLIAATVAIHAIGSVTFLKMLAAYRPFWRRHPGFLGNTLSFSWVVATLVVLHLAEIGVWATYFFRRGLFPDLETAIYYSFCSYTTVGFGDVVLPREWRLLGTTEALVGILMTSWSVALLIAVVTSAHGEDLERSTGKMPEG